MKCCNNCKWCLNSKDKEGNCVIDSEPNENNYCDSHRYIERKIKTYVLYDDKYLGPGYFIITEYDNNIVKFIKIYSNNCYGLPSYSIRGSEVDSFYTSDKDYRLIEIEAPIGTELFNAINTFAKSLNREVIPTININEGYNNLSAEVYKDTAFLILAEDIYGSYTITNFIDIELGDNLTCSKYESVHNLFSNLARVSSGQVNDTTMKRILRISK